MEKTTTNEAKSVFDTLYAIDCREVSRKKNGLTYLPWAWAWAEVKKHYPSAFYTVYEDVNGRNYHTDGRTAWVKTGVTIEGLELIEYLPVMDYRNLSISLEKLTSFDVNKSIQRSLTKACARHGLGLYIFAGEDLPEGGEGCGNNDNGGLRPRAVSEGKTNLAANDSMPAMDSGLMATPCTPAKAGQASGAEGKASAPNGGSVVLRPLVKKSAAGVAAAAQKSREVWEAFKALENVAKMGEKERNAAFTKLVTEAVGKAPSRDFTADDWEKVGAAIDVEGVL
jgi:hypothetical protein